MPQYLKNILRITLAVGLTLSIWRVVAAPHNGFDLSGSTIPVNLIMYGGPDKDGIPALDKPKFVKSREVDFLKPEDRILGIEIEGVARAYPISILNWHEIVNDQIRNQAFAVTYCPLCGTGVAFSATVDAQELDFGVSGLLYNSDVLLYDRQTESLWSQIKSEAISGDMVGHKLRKLPLMHTTWSDWQAQHPDSEVLSTDTGYSRDYSRDPYAGYADSRTTYFQVTHKAPPNYHPKERVLGVEVNGKFKAYPFSELEQSKQSVITDHFAGKTLNIHWNAKHRSARITDVSGTIIPAIEGFWFAWFTFHPETAVYESST